MKKLYITPIIEVISSLYSEIIANESSIGELEDNAGWSPWK